MPRFKSKKLGKAFFQSQDEAWTIESRTKMFQGQKLGSNQAGLGLFPALIEKSSGFKSSACSISNFGLSEGKPTADPFYLEATF